VDKGRCECCGHEAATTQALFCSQGFNTCARCQVICEAAETAIKGGIMAKRTAYELAIDEALKAHGEEVASWMPLPKGMPAVGQRIRILAPHPSAGHYGLVTEHKPSSVRQEAVPLVVLDNGVTVVLRFSREWEAAGPLR